MKRILLLAPMAALITVALTSCHQPAEIVPSEVTAIRRAGLPNRPEDAAWSEAPVYTANLLPQDVVEPRQLDPTTPEIRVQAASDGRRIAVRLAWDDPTSDDLPGAARFSDACAVQLPQEVTPDVPDPQMGDAAKRVDITFWRASWQAVVDGRGDTIQDLYPNASIDHYPFEAASLEQGSSEQLAMERRYAPARALKTGLAGPRERPVQDLVATGPGTLTTADSGASDGRGRHTPRGWEVVLSRPLPPGLEPGQRSVIAFAVWQGGKGEVGSRKMRSAWIPLVLQ